jgi:hypothetical protein
VSQIEAWITPTERCSHLATAQHRQPWSSAAESQTGRPSVLQGQEISELATVRPGSLDRGQDAYPGACAAAGITGSNPGPAWIGCKASFETKAQAAGTFGNTGRINPGGRLYLT